MPAAAGASTGSAERGQLLHGHVMRLRALGSREQRKLLSSCGCCWLLHASCCSCMAAASSSAAAWCCTASAAAPSAARAGRAIRQLPCCCRAAAHGCPSSASSSLRRAGANAPAQGPAAPATVAAVADRHSPAGGLGLPPKMPVMRRMNVDLPQPAQRGGASRERAARCQSGRSRRRAKRTRVRGQADDHGLAAALGVAHHQGATAAAGLRAERGSALIRVRVSGSSSPAAPRWARQDLSTAASKPLPASPCQCTPAWRPARGAPCACRQQRVRPPLTAQMPHRPNSDPQRPGVGGMEAPAARGEQRHRRASLPHLTGAALRMDMVEAAILTSVLPTGR